MTDEHDWDLSSVAEDKSFYAVAICRRCGLTRSALVSRGQRENYIDLSGTCPKALPPKEPLVEYA